MDWPQVRYYQRIMKTDFETLQALASYMINHLLNAKMIDFNVVYREALIDQLATELSVSFATDEDIQEQVVEEIEEKMGAEHIPEDLTESEIYNHAKKEIIRTYNGENIVGLYLVESLFQVGKRVRDFLFTCEIIEDVFGEDEEIVTFVVNKIRSFSLKRA